MDSPSTSIIDGRGIHVVWLTLLTFAVYVQVGGFGFVNYDDPRYVFENQHVKDGLTLDGIAWAVTSLEVSNWHPLTWLSYMTDVQLFGAEPGPIHLVNVVLHLLSTLLLFFLFSRMTGAVARSAVLAGLFALHPMHVESVAWISERKDVLSVLFGLSCLWFYARYAEKRSLGRYALVALSFALSLMAKPMLVTLPFALLLVDYWPLNRFSFDKGIDKAALTGSRNLILEKVPLLALAVGDATLTLKAQSGTLADLNNFSLYARFANAAEAYVLYVVKAVAPFGLRVTYTHGRDSISVVAALGSVVLLAGATYLLCWRLRRHRYLAFGWLWFLGTLVPVIGIVQVGHQAMADRYTYMPFIGLFAALVWGIADWAGRSPDSRNIVRLVTAAVMIGCAGLTYVQVGYWRNSVALFSRAVALEPASDAAYTSLGYGYLLEANRPGTALQMFVTAIGLDEKSVEAHIGKGMAHVALGQPRPALEAYSRAIDFDPDNAEAHNNIGGVLMAIGDYAQALTFFEAAEKLRPGYEEAQLGRSYAIRMLNGAGTQP